MKSCILNQRLRYVDYSMNNQYFAGGKEGLNYEEIVARGKRE